MLIKHLCDHLIVNSPTCGEIHDILGLKDNCGFGVAISINIKTTQGHFHQTFDETYFVIDGELSLEIYDPATGKTDTYLLKANELCVVSKGLHHKVLKASEKNRICIISFPAFHPDDEHLSDKI